MFLHFFLTVSKHLVCFVRYFRKIIHKSIKQGINVLDYILMQFGPTCILTYIYLTASILSLDLSACCNIEVSTFHMRCVCVSNFPLSHLLVFFPTLYKQGNSASFLLNPRCFFLFSVYLVSEFLVVFPASRFSISPSHAFPPLLASAFASAPPLPFARALLA